MRELYLHFPNTPSWRGAYLSTGTTLPYLSFYSTSAMMLYGGLSDIGRRFYSAHMLVTILANNKLQQPSDSRHRPHYYHRITKTREAVHNMVSKGVNIRADIS
jgi:hypothetical protein